jgi:hypothetical protein
MKTFSIICFYALNKKLEIHYFSFSLNQAKGEKVKKKQTRLRTGLWPTLDHRESLKTPKRLIKKTRRIAQNPFKLNIINL